MNETLLGLLVFLAGGLLGMMFFAGLWWTIQRCLVSPHPARWLLGSLLLRTGLSLMGFYLVADGDWQRLLLCLLGFVMARLLVTWLARPTSPAVRPLSGGSSP